MKNTKNRTTDYYVHSRLSEWARWAIKCATMGLGYSTRSIEGRLRDDGGVLAKSTAPLALPSHPDAEEMDALINELGLYDSALVEAIKIKYLECHTLDKAAKLRNISLPTLKSNLRLAKTWLAGRLQIT